MIKYDDYDKIINEHFDIEHTLTRKVLLVVNESDKSEILTKLTSKLYDDIVQKVDNIDFGDIPATKGDITKLENFDRLLESLETMRALLVEYRQDTEPVDIILKAVKNIEDRVDLFEKAFRYNIELPIVNYCTMVLSIVSSTSLMISSCVEYIKIPGTQDFKIAIDAVAAKKTREGMLFKSLARFNRTCDNGQFDKSMEHLIKNMQQKLLGADDAFMVVSAVAMGGLLLNILPVMRELIFFFYYSRTRMADYLEIQSELLNLNAQRYQQYGEGNSKERAEVAGKQRKIADIFSRLANKIAIDAKASEVKATKEANKPAAKNKIEDVVDSLPDSAASSLF